MELNDLLLKKDIDPAGVVVFRHRPTEPGLRKVLPWLAAERPAVFNAYQQGQTPRVEKALTKALYTATFIAHGASKALFVGLYKRGEYRSLNYQQYWRIPENQELRELGCQGLTGKSCLWFDLDLTDFYEKWKGRLVVDWPGPAISWWRWANRNHIFVDSILEQSAFDTTMPAWDELVLTWDELNILPSKWKAALSEWRGIYFIYDESDGKGYVGSAYGANNILGRWQSYAQTGHGGNKELRKRDPKHFRFSIIQRVSPDMEPDAIIRLESTWKNRLHTRAPMGMNEN